MIYNKKIEPPIEKSYTFLSFYVDYRKHIRLLPLVKLSLLILFASFFVSVLCLFFDDSIFKVIALPTIAVAIVGRSISIWDAIQKRSHEPIYKIHAKIEARATTLAIAKSEER